MPLGSEGSLPDTPLEIMEDVWIGARAIILPGCKRIGGRLLDSRTKGVQQKYVNSPESDIFHKERELYGLYQAKREGAGREDSRPHIAHS